MIRARSGEAHCFNQGRMYRGRMQHERPRSAFPYLEYAYSIVRSEKDEAYLHPAGTVPWVSSWVGVRQGKGMGGKGCEMRAFYTFGGSSCGLTGLVSLDETKAAGQAYECAEAKRKTKRGPAGKNRHDRHHWWQLTRRHRLGTRRDAYPRGV